MYQNTPAYILLHSEYEIKIYAVIQKSKKLKKYNDKKYRFILSFDWKLCKKNIFKNLDFKIISIVQ